jgi:predicted RNA binding protein YcfA (HicA-like mRNA interferase family)
LGKLRRMSGADVRQILERHGFVLARQRGSHMIMQQRLADTTITVPVPDHGELCTGTLASIIRQSKLPRELFEA